jgi:hypothetical protein
MAIVKKIVINQKSNCNCGKTQTFFEVNFSFDKKHLQLFSNNNFKENKSYTNVGILYVESKNLIAICPFGNNKIQVKCKNKDCDIDIFERILTSMS